MIYEVEGEVTRPVRITVEAHTAQEAKARAENVRHWLDAMESDIIHVEAHSAHRVDDGRTDVMDYWKREVER